MTSYAAYGTGGAGTTEPSRTEGPGGGGGGGGVPERRFQKIDHISYSPCLSLVSPTLFLTQHGVTSTLASTSWNTGRGIFRKTLFQY